ncbi:MAG: rod shape-determining protein MreD [Hahellaceae bacterium]|nr:rod shape-determining protein MreD [Hahellaceae bacterium]MCP5169025.1 rod shape-determining protein MreD [Hahellaceae bacterium]
MVARAFDWRLLFVSFFFAFVFSVVELPVSFAIWRPEWAAISVFYWTLRAPDHVGIVFAWCVGVLLDVLEGKILGTNGLALSVTAYLVLTLQQRLRLFPLLQQSFVVFMVVGINLMIGQLIRNISGDPVAGFGYLLPAVSSALLWPFLYLVIEKIYQKFR